MACWTDRAVLPGSVGVVLVLVTSVARPALADPLPRVVLFPYGVCSQPRHDECAEHQAVEQAVRAQLSDLEVELETTAQSNVLADCIAAGDPAHSQHASLVAWLDATAVFVCFRDSQGTGRVLVRPLERHEGDASFEVQALMIRAAVRALIIDRLRPEALAPAWSTADAITGTTAGVIVQASSAAEDAEVATGAVDTTGSVGALDVPPGEVTGREDARVSGAWTPGAHAAVAVTFGTKPGRPSYSVDLGASITVDERWQFAVGYAWSDSLRIDAEGVVAHVRRHPVSVSAMALGRVRALSLGLGARVIADYQSCDVSAPNNTEIVAPRAWAWSISPVARLRVDLNAPFRLVVEGGALIAASELEYVIATPEGERSAYAPWPVRPFAAVGLESAW